MNDFNVFDADNIDALTADTVRFLVTEQSSFYRSHTVYYVYMSQLIFMHDLINIVRCS